MNYRAVALRVVRRLHRMAWRLGSGQQVAGADRTAGGIGPAVDPAVQGHGLLARRD